MVFILVNIFFLIIAAIGLVILWFVWPPDSPWSPWWRTSAKKSIAAGKLAKISPKDLVYELGSGEATFLVTVVKKFGPRGVGIEIDPIRTFAAKINAFLNGVSAKIIFKRGNFYDYKISEATVVFVYLVPRVLEKLKPKLLKELKKGTKIISYKYKFKEYKKIKLQNEDKKNEIYLYIII